ncbi:hypothetical protein LTR64_002064 [Lithohypha guttulata]|uniref:uncharacterized protein n=1 Tax=Lithohypha guttulata TaxID=1690604 RepID=UPI002DDFFBC0|nr:hypothetical protein LTR51_007921 [Lithohypha guttulata]
MSRQKLSDILPTLAFGTATFNQQFNADPYALRPNDIVAKALESGIRAFDTSPYYGPAETILGNALHSPLIRSSPTLRYLRRSDYFILTKCGRIRGDEFDYSDSWVRFSVKRSCRRLRTTYLDVVYLHDIEFVSPQQVVSAIRTLRALRDQGLISVQNQKALGVLRRVIDAGVDVVTNSSPLGMGLCRSAGVPLGETDGAWHPAPDALKSKCKEAADWIEEEHKEKLEDIALRWAMESWLTNGAEAGTRGPSPEEATAVLEQRAKAADEGGRDVVSTHGEQAPQRQRVGMFVMGVSKVSELEHTMAIHRSIITAQDKPQDSRREHIEQVTRHIREHILGPKWTDFSWDSPDPGFTNTRKTFGVSELEQAEEDADAEIAAAKNDMMGVRQDPSSRSGSDIEPGTIVVTEEDLVCPVTGMKGKMPSGHSAKSSSIEVKELS